MIRTLEKNHKIKKIIQKIVKNYKPESIYVFGSYAWGKPTKDSDLDLFIVKDTKEDFYWRVTSAKLSLGDYYPMPMDIFVYTKKEAARAVNNSIFINKIINKGLKVYG